MDQQLQMQMMQMEILKLQALKAQQVQQYQADILAQAQVQVQRQQQRPLRRSSGFAEPATAGPTNTSFDLRTRTGPSDAFDYDDAQVPMTAAIGGKFGSRAGQNGLNPNANIFTLRGNSGDDLESPKSASTMNGRTTVISGGATLGAASNNAVTPSKSDSALSWRRGSIGVVTSTNTSQPAKTSSAAVDEGSNGTVKSRPQPLRFNSNRLSNLGVAVEAAEPEDGDDSDSSFTSDSMRMAGHAAERGSSPTTPPSAGSSDSQPNREDAAKKLYEGLGIGRPSMNQPIAPAKPLSAPVRQPRGPPASVDELGNRNFAARIPRVVVAEA